MFGIRRAFGAQNATTGIVTSRQPKRNTKLIERLTNENSGRGCRVFRTAAGALLGKNKKTGALWKPSFLERILALFI
jgi:hypothetical protein